MICKWFYYLSFLYLCAFFTAINCEEICLIFVSKNYTNIRLKKKPIKMFYLGLVWTFPYICIYLIYKAEIFVMFLILCVLCIINAWLIPNVDSFQFNKFVISVLTAQQYPYSFSHIRYYDGIIGLRRVLNQNF